MDDHVRATTHRHADADRVLQRLPRDDLGWLDAAADEFDDLAARLLRHPIAARVYSGDVGGAGQAEAHRLAEARHRACRAHHFAVADAPLVARLELHHVLVRDEPGAEFGVHLRVIGRADITAAIATGERGAAGDEDGGEV